MLDITQYFENGYVAPDIVKFFEKDLREQSRNMIDIEHSNLLLRYSTYLASNDFLDSVSDDMTKFRNQIVDKYSDITLTICGRIKSIVRLEEKFNGYIIRKSLMDISLNFVLTIITNIRLSHQRKICQNIFRGLGI